MTPRDFDRIARSHGLTRRQLAVLSLCQAQVYYEIRFSGLADQPESSFVLSTSLSGIQQSLMDRLQERGLVEVFGEPSRLRVTSEGWTIPCNAGASIFLTKPRDEDIIDLQPLEPLTRFGPQFSM